MTMNMLRIASTAASVTFRGAVIAVCIMPSMLLNVFPQLEPMLMRGEAVDGMTIILAIVQATTVIMMAVCAVLAELFIHRRAWSYLVPCLLFGLVLFGLNCNFAIRAIAKHGDSMATATRGAMTNAASISTQLAEARAQRARLGDFEPADEDALQAAKDAAAKAAKAVADECPKRGNRCLDREREEREAIGKRGDIAARKAKTDDARRLDAEIRTLIANQRKVGAAPKVEDIGSQKLAEAWAMLGINVTAEGVSTANAFAAAVIYEGIGLLMPLLIFAAISISFPPIPAPTPAAPVVMVVVAPVASEVVEAAPAAAEVVDEPEPLALPAPVVEIDAVPEASAEIIEFPAASDLPTGDVLEWLATVERVEGMTTRAGPVYAAYEGWCKTVGKTPVTQTMFGRRMPAETRAGSAKRPLYVGLKIAACGVACNVQ
jgi:hypothetical protein